MNGSIENLSMFEGWVHAELDSMVCRHKILLFQVFEMPRTVVQHRHMITRAHLIDNTDIIHLGKDKEVKSYNPKGCKGSRPVPGNHPAYSHFAAVELHTSDCHTR
jgi:hypothetical protein